MTDEAPPPRIEFFSKRRRNTKELVYYFRIRANNGQIIVPSQGYSRAVDRNQTAFHLRANLIEARIFDENGGEL